MESNETPEVALAYISPELKGTLRRKEVEYLRAKTAAAYSYRQLRLAELYTELADLFEQGEPMPGVDYPVA